MVMEHPAIRIKYLLRYPIASSDLYYSEMGLRDIVLKIDESGDFYIQGQIVGGDACAAIELCEIFLEYAMNCCAWCSADEALNHMQEFGQQIGYSIGNFLKENICFVDSERPIDHLLEHLFHTMHAHIAIKYSGAWEQFFVTDYPLEDAAARCGLRNIELAHYGINTLCQSMIQVINPHVIMNASPEIRPEFAFMMLKPEFA